MADLDFNVKKYGAKGIAQRLPPLQLLHREFRWLKYPAGLTADVYDAEIGAELDSVGIQRAIDAAHGAGGGTVIVPAGNYLIAPLRLRSRVRLHLEPGAFLWGSTHLEDYQGPDEEMLACAVTKSFQREAMPCLRRLISAVDAEDVSITGFGQISGQSPAFVFPWMNSRPSTIITDRPSDTIFFVGCRNVRVEDVRIVDTPWWTLVFDTCQYVKVRGVRIRCFDVINSDGIDLVDSSNVTISDCDIWCCDDGICLKSINPQVITAHIAVNNCVIRTLCNSLKLGTDSAGTFEDITFSNIVVYNPPDDLPGSERGSINLCAIDGGILRHVNISNIVMHNVYCPFFLIAGCRLPQQRQYRTPRPGRMENISITNVMAMNTQYTAFVVGDPAERIRGVTLSNIRVTKTAGFHDLTPPHVIAFTDQYPTPYMFGNRQLGDQLPAHGLYLRHVEQIVVRDFHVECAAADARAMVHIESADDICMTGLRSGFARQDHVTLRDATRVETNGMELAEVTT